MLTPHAADISMLFRAAADMLIRVAAAADAAAALMMATPSLLLRCASGAAVSARRAHVDAAHADTRTFR